MQKELIFKDRHKVLDQAKEIYDTLKNGHFDRKSVVSFTSFNDKNDDFKTYWNRSLINVRVEIPISDNEIAVLDTRFPETMANWNSDDNPHLVIITCNPDDKRILKLVNVNDVTVSNVKLLPLNREIFDGVITNHDNMISLEELRSIHQPGSPVFVRIFEEVFEIYHDGDGEPCYITNNGEVIITQGASVLLTDLKIKVNCPYGITIIEGENLNV